MGSQELGNPSTGADRVRSQGDEMLSSLTPAALSLASWRGCRTETQQGSFLPGSLASRKGSRLKKEPSAAAELPAAALGIARRVSCEHKGPMGSGTCPGKQAVLRRGRSKPSPGRGVTTVLGQAAWKHSRLLPSYAGEQGKGALGRRERPGEALGAVGSGSQSPGTSLALGTCHLSRDVRRGGCAGFLQGLTGLKALVSWVPALPRALAKDRGEMVLPLPQESERDV